MEVNFSPTFNKNPFDSRLHNHSLVGEYLGCRSFSITGDWRVIYKEDFVGKRFIFLRIGTHSQLYH